MYIKEPGAENRYQLLDLNEIIRSYESGEDIWSEAMYQLALKEKRTMCTVDWTRNHTQRRGLHYGEAAEKVVSIISSQKS